MWGRAGRCSRAVLCWGLCLGSLGVWVGGRSRHVTSAGHVLSAWPVPGRPAAVAWPGRTCRGSSSWGSASPLPGRPLGPPGLAPRGRTTDGSGGDPWGTRPGPRPLELRLWPRGGGEPGGRQTVSGQTWEPTHGPFSKAGAVPGAPAGSSGLFHWAHPSRARPAVEMQI